MTTDIPITQRDLQNAVANATLATQVSDVIRDVAALGARVDKDFTAMNGRLDAHDKRHVAEARTVAAERKADRRFRIMATIAALGAFAALLTVLLDVAARVH